MGKHWWQNVGDAISKGVSDTVHEIGRDVKRVTGNNDKPNPMAYSNMPNTNTGSSPYTSVPGQSPGGLPGQNGPPSMFQGAPPGFNQQDFENQIMTNPDLAGVWQTIQRYGGDIWGTISKFLPHNADGSIDWGKVGKDVIGWVKNNAQTIIEGAGAVANYQRQQKADDYAKQGLELSKQRFAENEPLRTAGRSGMLNPMANAPNLSSLRGIATTGSGNPFAGAPIPLRNAMPAAPQMPPARPPIPIAPQAPRPVPLTPPPSHAIPLSGASQAPTAAPSAAPSMPTSAMNGGQPMLSAQPIPLRTPVQPLQPVQPLKPRPIPLSFAQQPQPY